MSFSRINFRLALAIVALALAAGSLHADDSTLGTDEPLKVLFIGNSLTYTNEMPQIFQGLATSQNRRVRVAMQAAGDYTLEKHWKDGKAAEMITGGNWDVVVLQEHSTGPIENLKSMKEYAAKFHELIKKQNARTVLFMTWPPQNKMATQRRIAIAYEDLVKELGATVAPVGLAWQKALGGNKPVALHAADKKHPTEAGSYLTACVFYALLIDPKRADMPGRLVFNDKMLTNLEVADATRLQRAARDAVREEKEKLEAAAEKKSEKKPDQDKKTEKAK
jgi:hypothetical protein